MLCDKSVSIEICPMNFSQQNMLNIKDKIFFVDVKIFQQVILYLLLKLKIFFWICICLYERWLHSVVYRTIHEKHTFKIDCFNVI